MQRQDAYDGNLGVRASVVPVHRLHQRSYRFAEHGSTKEDTSAKAAGEAALADADSVTPAVTPTKSGRGHNGRGGKHGGRGRGLLTREEVYGTPDSDADNVGASSPPSLDRPAVLRMIGHTALRVSVPCAAGQPLCQCVCLARNPLIPDMYFSYCVKHILKCWRVWRKTHGNK